MTKRNAVHQIALLAILISLALLMGYVEHLLPLPIGIPGVKLGLSNLITVVALFVLHEKSAIIISLSRIFISGLLFGSFTSFCYSLAGGLLSLIIMLSVKHFLPQRPCTVSMLGGIAHNIGQIAVAALMLDSMALAFYLPVLVICGALTGFGIGLAEMPIEKALRKILYIQKEKTDRK